MEVCECTIMYVVVGSDAGKMTSRLDIRLRVESVVQNRNQWRKRNAVEHMIRDTITCTSNSMYAMK